MARIRTIKPEFVQSESTGRLSRDARLLFIQLWTITDDEGRTRAASRFLASTLYPYDDDVPHLIDGWLDELERENCIHRYEVDGACYLEITHWQKHQKIDRPSQSRLPASSKPRRSLAKSRETSRDLDADLVPSTLDLGPKDIAVAAAPAAPDGASVSRKAKKPLTRITDDWNPNDKNREDAKVRGLDDDQTNYAAEKFRDYWLQQPDRKGKKKDWNAAWRTWIDNQIEWRKGVENLPRAITSSTPSQAKVKVFEGTPQWKAWDMHLRATRGRGASTTDLHDPATERLRVGWYFESEWPPGYQPSDKAAA